jgi:hypothetical protein
MTKLEKQMMMDALHYQRRVLRALEKTNRMLHELIEAYDTLTDYEKAYQRPDWRRRYKSNNLLMAKADGLMPGKRLKAV